MATPINTSTYDQLNTDIQNILKTGVLPAISIYTNAEGTNLVVDSHGEIKDRQVMSVSHTESYIGPDGNPTQPYVTIAFSDGSIFTDILTVVDKVDERWFVLSSVQVPYTRFGSN